MDQDKQNNEFVFSSKMNAGKRRTYFFDVRETKGGDYYITITESTKRFNGDGFERHRIFLYKEDFNRFTDSLNEVVNHVKKDLKPDFDYEFFDRQKEEWEAKLAEENKSESSESEEKEEEDSNMEW